MKETKKIISSVFATLLLSFLIVQVVHSFHHYKHFESQISCFHNFNENKTILTHTHHVDDCNLAHFVFPFAEFSIASIFELNSEKQYYSSKFYTSYQFVSFFEGSKLLLRGPPIV